MIHIRNCVTPFYGATDFGAKFTAWLYREIFLLAGWTEVANNGDAAWASNVITTLTDFYVDPASPSLIKTAAGNVSAHVGRIISLRDPNNDANCIMANIRAVAGTDTLILDDYCVTSPWVAASSLTGRIHIGGQSAMLAYGAWTVLQAPGSGNQYQLRLTVSGVTANRFVIDCLPKGDYAGAKTYTAVFNHDYASQTRVVRINADIAGDLFMVWNNNYVNTGVDQGAWYGIAGGTLDVSTIAPTDLYPRFLTSCLCAYVNSWNPMTTNGFFNVINMLSYTDTQISPVLERPKAFSDESAAGAYDLISGGISVPYGWMTCDAIKVPTIYPWVVMPDVLAGGYRRGKLPFRLINVNWQDWRFMNVLNTRRTSPGAVLLPSAGSFGIDKYPPITTLT
jgi:hypothetical protein